MTKKRIFIILLKITIFIIIIMFNFNCKSPNSNNPNNITKETNYGQSFRLATLTRGGITDINNEYIGESGYAIEKNYIYWNNVEYSIEYLNPPSYDYSNSSIENEPWVPYNRDEISHAFFKVKFINGSNGVDIGLAGYVDPNLITNSSNSEIILKAYYSDSVTFPEDNAPGENPSLYINDDGYLTFELYGFKTNVFFLEFNDNRIKFGDDFVLNFKAKVKEGGPEIYSFNTSDQTKINDFLYFFAVYDYRLLWRANLYINENNDWNNQKPWNSTDNEWNKDYSGNTRINLNENITSLNSLNDGNGNQNISINPFTYNPDYGSGNESDAVAYAYGCHDTPFDFNEEMVQQRDFLNDYYGNYIETTAPSSVYSNYRFPKDTGTSYPTHNSFKTINGIKCFPYLPGYSTKNNDPNNYYWVNAISAGTDCIGFVQMSSSYSGRNYSWPAIIARHYPGASNLNNTCGRVFPDYSTSYSTDIITKNDYDTGSNKLNIVIPGNMVIIGADTHIAMVQNVLYPSNTRTTTPSQIQLIESQYGKIGGHNIAKVINIQHLDSYNSWKIVRIK